jgi:hypothetical protein
MLVQAYRFGTFSKIPEFIRFRDRLTHSLQKVVSESHQFSNDFFFEWTSFEDQKNAFKDKDFSALVKVVKEGKDGFSDNRDPKVIPHWSFGPNNATEIISGSTFPYEEVCSSFCAKLNRCLSWNVDRPRIVSRCFVCSFAVHGLKRIHYPMNFHA